MKKETKQIGSFSILTGLGATLVAGLLAWVFSTTLENKVTFAPVVDAVNRLNKTINDFDTKNTKEHLMIIDKLNEINTRVTIGETKLKRVISDCKNTDERLHNYEKENK